MAENTLLEKVLSLQDKYKKLEQQLADPAVIADMKKFVQLNKDYKELQPIIAAGLEYKRLVDELSQAKDILINEKDEDLKEMAKEEIAQIEPQLPEMEQNIKLLLIPADPDDSKNAMVEIRGGTGGDEAAIFAGDLFRMYQHFAERRGWKLEITDQAPGTSGGFKQIVFKLSSSQDGVYGVMHGFGRSSGAYVVSYRDPNVAETFQVLEQLPDQIAGMALDQETLDGYIMNAYSAYAMPLGELTGAASAGSVTTTGNATVSGNLGAWGSGGIPGSKPSCAQAIWPESRKSNDMIILIMRFIGIGIYLTLIFVLLSFTFTR